jgi:putative ABC transport system permease protein
LTWLKERERAGWQSIAPEAPGMTAIESLGRFAWRRASVVRPWRSRMTRLIAWRNLVHDRVRFAVTLVGIAFATILMGLQLGMLLNFMRTTSTLIDHAGADIWVAARGIRAEDLATPLQERRRYQALSVPGVAVAENYLINFGFWKRPDGLRETVIVIGIEPDATMGAPWTLPPDESAHDLLSAPDAVVVDRLYASNLGVERVGDVFEINDRRVRVTGFTQGIRTFTQSPYVFTSLRNSRLIGNRPVDDINYVLVRVASGFSPDAVVSALAARMPDVDVLRPDAFAKKSQNYWLYSTGAGITMISTSILALLVGVVIAAQTLYASTMDRLPEYATIRAMGGPRSYLYRIVVKQAAIGGLLGYACGIAIVLLLAWLARNGSASPVVPFWLCAVIGVVTLAMCVVASLVSLGKVTAIDPVAVFR